LFIVISTDIDWPLDLKKALGLEPTNESVKQELKKVESLLLQTKSKQSTVGIRGVMYMCQAEVQCA
jgi:hypothetical protein